MNHYSDTAAPQQPASDVPNAISPTGLLSPGMEDVSRANSTEETRSRRRLSKSDFILARTCDPKLYFRENGYPDNGDSNPYLALLAEGGYMVEALAKARYADGIQLDYGINVHDEAECTTEYLRRDAVTLFEATLLVGGRQARADILERRGSAIRLLEVKSKSFDGAEHTRLLSEGKGGLLRASRKPYCIRAEWAEKLEDITYQVLLLEKMLPGIEIRPFLVLIDTSKHAELDNIPGFFELVRRDVNGDTRLHTARYTGTAEQLMQLDLLTEVDVSAEVAMLRAEVEEAAERFEARLDAPLAVHAAGVERGSKCAKCEFRVDDAAARNGYADCWGSLAHVKPHVLELYSVGTVNAPDGTGLVDWMYRKGDASLLDVPEGVLVRKDGTVGPTADRQRRQIEYTRRNEAFIGPDLQRRIESLQGPLHFIDFETSRLALPYHQGMRPYGLVTFQWSCHKVRALGDTPVHAEWLNSVDVWPNQSFAESLRTAIGDKGHVLTWSHFEATTLRQIVSDLETFGRDVPDLVAWMKDVLDRRIVDLHEWARNDFYHPRMRGRTSIKVVLDALWQTDEALRRQFEQWTGFRADPERDPYVSLPPIEIGGTLQDVHEGTGAMRAYQEMMYGTEKHDRHVTAKWASLLKQYCALDSLSMVLILEYWRRAINPGCSTAPPKIS